MWRVLLLFFPSAHVHWRKRRDIFEQCCDQFVVKCLCPIFSHQFVAQCTLHEFTFSRSRWVDWSSWTLIHCMHIPQALSLDQNNLALFVRDSGFKILLSQILLDTSFYHCLQAVIIRSSFSLWWISRSYNSNTVLKFCDSRFLSLYNPLQDFIRWDFRHGQLIFFPFRIEFLQIIISRNNCKQVGIILDRIIGSSDPEVLVDQVSDLSSTKENGPASGPLVPPDWFFFWGENYGLFCSVLKRSTNTSKFGIRITPTEHKYSRSSTESTISTSLIQCIASVRNCEQVRIPVLNLTFQQANVAGVVNLSKMKIRNLQSLLVCSIILWNLLSLVSNEFLVDSLDWHLGSKAVSGVCRSLVTCGGVCFRQVGNPRIESFWMRRWRRRRWIFKKKFPDIPCVSKMFGGLSLRVSIHKKRLSIPPGPRKSGSNAGWLGTWDSPQRTDSAS